MGKLGYFLVGGVIGAGLALLFAPRSGEETRAIVADKADEYWGKGREIYGQGKTRIQSTYAEVQPVIAKKGDELREKIDSARTLIAEQVAKNAASAREVFQDKMPGASDKLNQAADVVRGHIDTATSKIKEAAANKSAAKEAAKAETADVVAAPAVVASTTEAIPGLAGSESAVQS